MDAGNGDGAVGAGEGVINLDNNATTRPCRAALAAMVRGADEVWHNPSSVHRAGQQARQAVELARQQLAELAGVNPKQLILTGSGTESIDLAIRGVLSLRKRPVLVTDDAEHAAVRDLAAALETFEGVEVRRLPLGADGVIDASDVAVALDAGDVSLVSVQWANNETGVVQPVDAIGAACRGAGVPFHCDGTQWIGKEPCLAAGTRAPVGVRAGATHAFDMLTFSPHKFHGPKGVGCLYVRRGVGLRPRVHGTQELGRRGGTENVPGVLGAGAAAAEAAAWLASGDERERLRSLRDGFEAAVVAGCRGAVVHGAAAAHGRLWNTSSIGFPRLEAEALLMLLSERGVLASAGAACSSGSLEPSPVLLSMGIPPEVAHGTVRFSLSRDTRSSELDEAAAVVRACVERLSRSLTG